MHSALLGVLVLAGLLGSAVADEKVRTEDGRTILLKDNGTYEIINQSAPGESYRAVSFDDFLLAGDTLLGKRVALSAFLFNDGNSVNQRVLVFKDNSMTKGSIWVDFRKIPISEKRLFLERCNGLCRVKIEGVVDGSAVLAEHLRL